MNYRFQKILIQTINIVKAWKKRKRNKSRNFQKTLINLKQVLNPKQSVLIKKYPGKIYNFL